MIWFRRFIAVILALLFTVFFIVMLFVSRINATLGNPHFYVDQLRKADIYNFVYDRVLPAALEEVEFGEAPQDMPLDIGEFQDEALILLREVVPPQWIQTRVEDAIAQVMPYLLGDTEKFAVTVPLNDRVQAAQQALKDTLYKGDAFPKLYDQMVAQAVDQASAKLDELPFKPTLTKQELDSIARKLIPRDWLLSQIDQAIDQVFPYLAGNVDNFTISIELKSRVEAAGDVVIDVLGKPQTYDYIFDEVAAPQLVQQVSQSVQLPFGITLTNEEVATALRQILPQPWFKARLEDLVKQTVSYLNGDSDTIAVAIPLADRKAATMKVLDDRANDKLKSLWQSLPEARPEQVPDMRRSLQAGQLPSYRLPGVSYEQLRQMVNIDFSQIIDSAIIKQIPDQVEITQAGLAQLLGEQDGNALSRARQYVTQGWKFTDADLHRNLGAENAAGLEDVRSRIKSGFTFTQADLRQRLLETSDNGEDTLANLDQMRHWLKTARRWLFAGWILPALLLVAMGASGARKLAGKIAWGSAALGIAALIAFLAAGPVYSSVARPALETALSQPAQQAQGVALVAIEKASQIAYNAADSFMLGLRQQALITLALALVGLGLGIILPRVRKQPQAHWPQSSQNNNQ